MDEDRISHAVTRIERALARIETQAALSGGSARDGAANAALVARHESLRETVSASLAELDALIGRLES